MSNYVDPIKIIYTNMVSVLLVEVNENSHILEECNVIRLTIGYYTVCDKIKRNEVKIITMI